MNSIASNPEDAIRKSNAYDFASFVLSCLIYYDEKGDVKYRSLAYLSSATGCTDEYYDRIVSIYKASIVSEDGFDESDPMHLAVRDFQYEKAARTISNPTMGHD